MMEACSREFNYSRKRAIIEDRSSPSGRSRSWQALNVTAFLASGVAVTSGTVGDNYEDGSSNRYLPMFGQPVMIYSSDATGMRRTLERIRSRGVTPAIYTYDLFATNNDEDNRAAVKDVAYEKLDVVGLAFHARKNASDKILKGLRLHQ